METSEESISAFMQRLQDGLTRLGTIEKTVDQAYSNFCSTEQESVSAMKNVDGASEARDEAEASPGEVLQALERLFRTLVEVGFLSRLTDMPESETPQLGSVQPPVLHDALVEAKENMLGQARAADMQTQSTHECYQRMKSQISEQRTRATQLLSDAQSLLEMRSQAEELEAKAQQLRVNFEDTSRTLGLVQQRTEKLEAEKLELQAELGKQPLQPVYTSDAL
eukprot:jgi/Ulvmu1/3973/UM182_0001.1